MPSDTGVIGSIKNTVEQTAKTQIEEVAKQVSPMPKEMLKMLYWSDDSPPDTSDSIAKKKATFNASDTHNLNAVRNKYSSILGKTETPSSPPNSEPPQKQNAGKMALEHHREASNLGKVRNDETEQMEAQRKQDLENEMTNKKRVIEERMNNPIEAQGKTQGAMRRKKSSSKMQRPPKSSENKVGQGGRE